MSDGSTDARTDVGGLARQATDEAGRAEASADREPEIETDIIDLSGLSLSDLDQLGHSVLGTALRRILERDGEPATLMVGFQSGI